MKVAVAQVKPTIGDLAGNLNQIKQSITSGIQNNCDVVLFPELVTTGYPPRDLLYCDWFWDQHAEVIKKLETFVKQSPRNITAIVGGLHQQQETYGNWSRYNAAFVISKHHKTIVVHKRLLPCYDVFDETRYFKADLNQPCIPIPIRCTAKNGTFYDVECDVLICEDIWNNEFKSDIAGQSKLFPASYGIDPIGLLKSNGPLFVLNGSPYWGGKVAVTQNLVESITKRINRPVLWCNAIGCYDDIVLAGYSMVSIPSSTAKMDDYSYCRPTTRIGRFCQEDFMLVDLGDKNSNHNHLDASSLEANANFFYKNGLDLELNGKKIEAKDIDNCFNLQALIFATREYANFNGFTKAVFGASGGIDSALVGAIAALAFGGHNVTAIAMPSPYSSQGSLDDAEALAKAFNMRYEVVKITEVYESLKNQLLTASKQKFSHNITDENLQARIRGMILTAHSNDDPREIVLSTGNKSEIAVGYCTLYGDMCGGYAVISDVPKTLVWQLSKFINKYYDMQIPTNSIEKPPSAELKPDQKDTDSLPPYDRLDQYLRWIVEEYMTVGEILNYCASNKIQVDPIELNKVYRMYRIAEYKRKQMPIGPKLTRVSFGSGRRMPISMKLSSMNSFDAGN